MIAVIYVKVLLIRCCSWWQSSLQYAILEIKPCKTW